MGNLFSSEEESLSSSSGNMGDSKKKKSNHQNYVLLGTGESGKSTMLKQIKLLFKEKLMINNSEKEMYVNVILGTIIMTLKAIHEYYSENDIQYTKEMNKVIAQNIVDYVKQKDIHLILNGKAVYTKYHKEIVEFFKEETIEAYFDAICLTKHIFDGAKYFINRLDEIDPLNYEPTDLDILKCRRKTTGVSRFEFSVKKNQKTFEFNFVDVGGQKSERKKWIESLKNFEGLDGVIFIASLNEYNQKCYEDDFTNRMTESLDLFDTYINGSHFKNKPVILILNKYDLFKKKIQFVKLSETFEEYTGNSEKEALEFIKTQFLDRNAYAENRIHVFVAEATSIENVEKILNDILDLCDSGKLIAE